MSALGRLRAAVSRLWPAESEPPRADGSFELLAAVALAQLERTLAVLPGWHGLEDGRVESRCSYGHTHVRIEVVRTSAVAVPHDQRLAAAKRAMRDILRTYTERALPGEGFEQHRAIGDSSLTLEVRWIL